MYNADEELFHFINTNGTTFEDYLTMVNKITDLSFTDRLSNRSYLHVAIQAKKQDVIEDLLKRGINVNMQDISGNTAACYFIASENWEGLRKLLSYGVDPNLGDNFNNTLLFKVLLRTCPGSEERYEVVKDLLAIGANPEIENTKGNSALSFAIRQKDEKLVEMFTK